MSRKMSTSGEFLRLKKRLQREGIESESWIELNLESEISVTLSWR